MDKVANGNMKLKLFYELQEVLGDQSGVTGARLRSTETGATEDLPVTGVFIAIGHKPNTGIFNGQVDMENGYIVTRRGLKDGKSTRLNYNQSCERRMASSAGN